MGSAPTENDGERGRDAVTMDQQWRRNSLRYQGYDYTQIGGVFVTLCTHHRQHLFGIVIDGQMAHSQAGALACDRWRSIPDRFPEVAIDEFVVMPDHVHGILWTGLGSQTAERGATPGDVIRWFKATVHAGYRYGVLQEDWTQYDRHLWHRDYHDHVLRNDADLERIRQYIASNPARWHARRQTA